MEVIVGQHLQQPLESLLSKPFLFGVLISHVSQSKHLILGLIPTPLQEDLSESTKDMPRKLPDRDWIIEHAVQISRILPGGVFVGGLFTLDQQLESEASNNFVSSLLADLNSQLLPFHRPPSSQRIFLTLMQPLTKSNYKAFDISPLNASSKSHSLLQNVVQKSDTKFADILSEFSIYETNLTLDHQITTSNSVDPIHNQFQMGLDSYFAQIDEAITTIDQTYPLSKFIAKEGPHQVDFFLEKTVQHTNDENFMSNEHLHLHGSLYGCAYLLKSSPSSEAIKAIANDIKGSLKSRVDLILENIENTETEQSQKEGKWILRKGGSLSAHKSLLLPTRVAVPFHPPIQLYDFLLPGEDLSNCAERLLAMAGIEVERSSMDVKEGSLLKGTQLGSSKEENGRHPLERSQKSKGDGETLNNNAMCILGLLLLTFATAAILLFLTQTYSDIEYNSV
eukprot:TRINITY_DN15629_c0_g1_i1.p1 TRINITY_DN15629_c0_g1~~TRINITY_DN15629_c0_g1_i1.p1  ORF type:complete len:451 (-),score=92.15 TRINITY_DN15629_c0_g1_i1:36-1388(-)